MGVISALSYCPWPSHAVFAESLFSDTGEPSVLSSFCPDHSDYLDKADRTASAVERKYFIFMYYEIPLFWKRAIGYISQSYHTADWIQTCLRSTIRLIRMCTV